MKTTYRSLGIVALLLTCLPLYSQNALLNGGGVHSFSYAYAKIGVPIAGVAGGLDVVFVGEPLNGKVIALSRLTGRQIGELPQPPNGFALPLIMHSLGEGRLAVLDAGGLPMPNPFVPANPIIYEYRYAWDLLRGFSASLTRTVSFASVLVGFPEDFVHLDDGRYLLSDAVLGSIWIAQPNGSILPGIVPKSFDPQDWIPTLAFVPAMPLITVNGYPFLFTGSTIPGVSPLAVRDGKVYYYSPCARGIYSFPLGDSFRQSYSVSTSSRHSPGSANSGGRGGGRTPRLHVQSV